VEHARKLTLFHFWVAFGLFLLAAFLGAWQMLMRSPLPAPFDDPNAYYASVTLHGTVMAYVLTTFFFAMGFGYAVTATSLGRPVRGVAWAWICFVICLVGTLMAAAPVLAGRATVLYTFYPPLLGSRWYYLGAFLLIGGSMIWVALMVVNMIGWKRDNPGHPVPLAMFAITATALQWAWTAAGAELELVGILLPRSFGWGDLVDAGLARTLFSVTLHGIVYFWLMPAYIAFYTLLPPAGGRLYSDMMGRLAFVMLLVFSVPVGMHHLLADPEHGTGFKFLQSSLTFLVALPTLLTVFSICASLEVAGRVRGGRGLLGWIGALPWDEPMVLATGLSLVMLGLGGLGGFINMSYAMNLMIHNTSWVTAHFHLIFGGTTVIMYFAIAYELWPAITGKPLRSKHLAIWQLWLWFSGMLITSIPWHVAGLMGQPRRVAVFDYGVPFVARTGPLVIVSVIGGFILLASAILLIVILVRSHLGGRTVREPLRYALAVNPPRQVPVALNGFALWNAVLAVLMVVAYGYPIGQFFFLKAHSVPAIEVTGQSAAIGMR
jgi:cytochrome c oxidase subunit 1